MGNNRHEFGAQPNKNKAKEVAQELTEHDGPRNSRERKGQRKPKPSTQRRSDRARRTDED